MRVIYSFPGAMGARTGIGTASWHQAESLARRGVDVHVVCARLVRPFPTDTPISVHQTFGGIPQRVIGLERSRRIHDRVVVALVRRRRPDIVHVWPRATLRTAQAAHRVGASVVREAPSPYTRTAAGQAALAWEAEGLTLPEGHFHAQSEAEMHGEDLEFGACDLITVAARSAVDTFAESAVATPVEYVPQGFDPREFPVPDSALPPGRDIVFVGRGEPTKGFPHLLRVWPRVAVEGARLLVVGAVDPLVAEQHADVLARPDVETLGYRDDVADILRRARALVMPSHSEGGGPLVAYEAVGAGAIPVVSNRCGLEVDPGVTGLVHDAGDEDALARHIAAVLDDDVAATMRRELVTRREQWTWDRAARDLAALYLRLRSAS